MPASRARGEARPVVWPRALGVAAPGPAPEPAASAIALPFDVSLADLAAQAGPEFARSLGFGLAAEPVPAAETRNQDAGADRLPVCLLHDGTTALRLELEGRLAGPLTARMFGAGNDAAHGPVPGARSASWQALRGLMAEALREAFLRAGARGRLTVEPADLPAKGPGSAMHAVRLRLAETEGMLWLCPAQVVTETAQASPARTEARDGKLAGGDPEWRRRAQALARQTELGVTLQVAELRLPLAAIGRMKAGDILPIRRPRQLRLMSGGAAIASLPAAALGAGPQAMDDPGEDGR